MQRKNPSERPRARWIVPERDSEGEPASTNIHDAIFFAERAAADSENFHAAGDFAPGAELNQPPTPMFTGRSSLRICRLLKHGLKRGRRS